MRLFTQGTLQEDEEHFLSLSGSSSDSGELNTYQAIVAPRKFFSSLKKKVGNFFFGKKPSSKDVEAGEGDGDDEQRRSGKHSRVAGTTPSSTGVIPNSGPTKVCVSFRFCFVVWFFHLTFFCSCFNLIVHFSVFVLACLFIGFVLFTCMCVFVDLSASL